ncbi:MAG: hypothetical protein IJZ23_12610 [Roseburia sp.]|nr:hypothetical protein [Roseburia sp.]
MKYISDALFVLGIISGVIAFAGLCLGINVMLVIRLMTGGVIAMGVSNILTECYEWWEELQCDGQVQRNGMQRL